MKKIVSFLMLALAVAPAFAQSCYWVFLTDKQGTTFDPYTYFDAKAIERYQQCGADLYDISNYPLNDSYVSQVDALALEEVGCSRWFNAVAVMATPAQIAQIEQLPFVLRTQALAANMQLAQVVNENENQNENQPQPSALNPQLSTKAVPCSASPTPKLSDQLLRMQGDLFREHGIDGTGMRIAVLDGGFPRVNTHDAFKHLRDNHRILDTWNFPNKKANVYGWNSHGLSTLSCIAGIIDGQQIGLATGAEFLLYRTEIGLEPFKEEVWWQMGMERADQHGANIISSSLGYGKERHYTYEMDGRSYVAKAAVMAARKGILVCNSAGNEGTDMQWKTIITPADADSVLCVGGIESSLRDYRHIAFSSYGPAADGRLKPDVSAFGHALAADNKSDKASDWVYGTSFSCPLTAGFAACAWQTMRGKTAMQMLREIQQSGDLYPYYDYALGYGVPQASHFVGPKAAVAPTFRLVETADSVEVRFPKEMPSVTVFYNKQAPNGRLIQYASRTLCWVTPDSALRFHKGAIDSCRLNVWVDGYTASYQGKGLRPQDTSYYQFWGYYGPRMPQANALMDLATNSTSDDKVNYNRNDRNLRPSKVGSNAKFRGDTYFMLGDMVRTYDQERDINAWSPATHVGIRLMRAFGKSYSWGLAFDLSNTRYNFAADKSNPLDNLFNVGSKNIDKKSYRYNEFSIELFQRVRFVGGGLMSKGLHWDLGGYVGFGHYNYIVRYNKFDYADEAVMQYRNPSHLDNARVNFGLTTRFTYDLIGIYARYRLTNFATSWDVDPANPSAFQMKLPRLEAGLMINL